MAKRKITVTIDEEVVEQARKLGDSHLSAVVNAALAEHVERMARNAALGDLLDGWDDEFGPVSDEDAQYAEDAFAELDGSSGRREIA
ncbi:type II toxin-antitoxin system CcdA family antitoxin [Nocardia sp. NPDC059180]|uniref:type II toxin-antitoxin system CcdA family antitoxin n=1 Tax=Nocardia sp. NPDC059180 TaxID=3346761 RepID=UPI0036A3DC26